MRVRNRNIRHTSERTLRWALVAVAVVGLAAGIGAWLAGRSSLAALFWMLATVPVIAGLAVSIVRDLAAGRLGVEGLTGCSCRHAKQVTLS